MDRTVLSGVSGTFIIDESVTFGSTGATGTLRRINGSSYYISIPALPEGVTRDNLAGEVLMGGVSAATGTVTSTTIVEFIIGEAVVGSLTSAAAVVHQQSPLVADNPTGAFGPNELGVGQVSGATAKLGGSPAYSGLVVITVENEFGRRNIGDSLVKAFTYF